jgi:riboflavin kinase/FMN adenylyltransferase
MLLQHHMDKVLELPFDRAMMTMPWQDFFRKLLQEHQAAGLVCGEDFRFGSRGEGNSEKLRRACAEAGIPCVVVPQKRLDGVVISSTHIRRLLTEGSMAEAVRFLGHPHVLTGQIVQGRQLGRTIGIPTANMALPEGVAELRHGVYACKVCIDGTDYMAVTNVGTRPTVEGHHVTVEPWILDFDGDLYGRVLTLRFYEFLRPEQKFASLNQLREEIRKNAVQTRKIFEKS